MAPWACGEAPFSIWRLWQGIEAVLRGLVLTFFASVSVFSRLRWFRFLLRSYRGFVSSVFSFALGVGSSFARLFRVCVYSGVSYSDHSSKLTTF